MLLLRLLLQVQEHGTWIFDGALDGSEESDGFSPVHQPVVVRQGQVHHRANHNLEIKGNSVVNRRIWQQAISVCRLEGIQKSDLVGK